MRQIKKSRDLRDWEEIRMNLAEERGMDEEQIAAIADADGDSLDLVETCRAREGALWFKASKAAQKLTLGGRVNRMGRLLRGV